MQTSCAFSHGLLLALVAATPFVSHKAACAQAPAKASPTTASLGPIIGQSLIIVVPRSRNALLAYSKETGRWYKQPIKPTEKTPITPIVGAQVAAVRVDNQIFAFSAINGAWASVAVPAGSKAVPIVHSKIVTLRDGSNFYVFSANSGQWTGIDLEDGKSIK
jgi:hypothetical protein